MEIEVVNRWANTRETLTLNYKLGNEFALRASDTTVHHVFHFCKFHCDTSLKQSVPGFRILFGSKIAFTRFIAVTVIGEAFRRLHRL